MIDAFFDELTKIAGPIGRANAALERAGSSIGDRLAKHPHGGKIFFGGLGALHGVSKSIGEESRERMADERAKLSPEETKKMRRKRLLRHHIPRVLGTAGAGAALPGIAKKVTKDLPSKVMKGMGEEVGEEIGMAGRKAVRTFFFGRKNKA